MTKIRQIGTGRVVIWRCFREGHRRVEWLADVARCAEPGCGITSEDRPAVTAATAPPPTATATTEADVLCTADQGYCDRPAVAYIFGRFPTTPDAEGRMTIVAGRRGRWLAERQPDGARCVDHALEELEALADATRKEATQK